MTQEQFEYLKRAIEALGSGELTQMGEIKVLRTMSQITESAAQKLESKLVDNVDSLLYNTTN